MKSGVRLSPLTSRTCMKVIAAAGIDWLRAADSTVKRSSRRRVSCVATRDANLAKAAFIVYEARGVRGRVRGATLPAHQALSDQVSAVVALTRGAASCQPATIRFTRARQLISATLKWPPYSAHHSLIAR